MYLYVKKFLQKYLEQRTERVGTRTRVRVRLDSYRMRRPQIQIQIQFLFTFRRLKIVACETNGYKNIHQTNPRAP